MGDDAGPWFGVIPSTARVGMMQTISKKMLPFERTKIDGVGGILAELGGVKMKIKVPKNGI
jgi:hypothetical protein